MMKKVLLVPDSFKGTMSSGEICEIMARAIRAHYPTCDIVSIPVADGGEGTVDSFLEAVGGEKIRQRVKGPHMDEVDSFYGILPDGTAIIEMAAAAGLPMAEGNPHVEKATTYGVGQLLMDALVHGCRKVVLGLGGSATNDLGCGAAAAMGVRFTNKAGDTFIPVGETLDEIAGIDTSAAVEALKGVTIIAMCDIDNPLYGENGAAYVFSPQKGADNAMVQTLDEKLRVVSNTIHEQLEIDISRMPGAGAAGGMGAGVVAFLGATLQMGIETVLDTVEFDVRLKGADLVFTGEGKIDQQSLGGKVVVGVGKRAKRQNVPAVAIVGDIGDGVDAAYELGIAGIFSINRVAVPYQEARSRARDDMYNTMDNLIRFLSRMLNQQ